MFRLTFTTFRTKPTHPPLPPTLQNYTGDTNPAGRIFSPHHQANQPRYHTPPPSSHIPPSHRRNTAQTYPKLSTPKSHNTNLHTVSCPNSTHTIISHRAQNIYYHLPPARLGLGLCLCRTQALCVRYGSVRSRSAFINATMLAVHPRTMATTMNAMPIGSI
jgi:hypothetical protein